MAAPNCPCKQRAEGKAARECRRGCGTFSYFIVSNEEPKREMLLKLDEEKIGALNIFDNLAVTFYVNFL